MAERICIVESGEPRLDAATARRQCRCRCGRLRVLAAAALIELQPARSAPTARRPSRPRHPGGVRPRRLDASPRLALDGARASRRVGRRSPRPGHGGGAHLDRRCGNSDRTRRNTAPECAAIRCPRSPCRGASPQVRQQRRLADQRARFDSPFDVVDGERQFARQNEIGRIRPARRAEQRSPALSVRRSQEKAIDLHRLARQQVERAGSRHAPNIGFEAHRPSAPRERFTTTACSRRRR